MVLGGLRISVGLPSLIVGAIFMAVHLAFQIFALLQAYLSGMAHFDDPLSRQAAWESQFWERASTVATFPLVRLWEYLPLTLRSRGFLEWGFLAGNSLLWAMVLVGSIRWISGLFGEEEEE